MELESLIDHCNAIENTVTVLIKANSGKQSDLEHVHDAILQQAKDMLDRFVEREEAIRVDLDKLKLERQDIETEVKALTDVNERLTQLVSLLQESSEVTITGNSNNAYASISSTILDFEHLRGEMSNIRENYSLLQDDNDCLKHDISEIKSRHKSLANSIELNYNTLRITEGLNQLAEKQFDLILSEVPWEPISVKCISDLRDSNNEAIKNYAESLIIQTQEINNLVETIGEKKNRKLRLLEELYEELDTLLKNREQSVLMSKFRDRDHHLVNFQSYNFNRAH